MSEKTTLLFAFGNQKGGAGKSTLNTVFGNYLHLTHGKDYSFSAVDADDLQRTFFQFRVRDLEIDMNEYEDRFDALKKVVFEKEKEYGLYHVLCVPSENFMDTFIDSYNGAVDMMAIDLPGNLKQPGVMDSYKPVEVLFVPCNPINDSEIDSTRKFLKIYEGVDALREELGWEPAEKYILMSRVDRKMGFDREKFQKNFEKFNVKFLENYFPYSPGAFGRDVNTLLQFKKNNKDTDTEKLCIEIFDILKKKYIDLNS